MRKVKPMAYNNEIQLRDGLYRLGFKCKRVEDPEHVFTHCCGYPVHVEKIVFIDPNFDVDILPKQPNQFNATAVLTIKGIGHQVKLYGGNSARIECITPYETLVEFGKKKKELPKPQESTGDLSSYRDAMYLYDRIRGDERAPNNRVFTREALLKAMDAFSERVKRSGGAPVSFGEHGHNVGVLKDVELSSDGVVTGTLRIQDEQLSEILFNDHIVEHSTYSKVPFVYTTVINRKPLRADAEPIPDYHNVILSFSKKLSGSDVNIKYRGCNCAKLKGLVLSSDESMFGITIEPIDAGSEDAMSAYHDLINVLNDATSCLGTVFMYNADYFDVTGIVIYKNDNTREAFSKPKNVLAMAFLSDTYENRFNFYIKMDNTMTNSVIASAVEEKVELAPSDIFSCVMSRYNVLDPVEEHLEFFIQKLNVAFKNAYSFIKLGSEENMCMFSNLEVSYDRRYIFVSMIDPSNYFKHISHVVYFKIAICVDKENNNVRVEFYGSTNSSSGSYDLLGVSDWVHVDDMPEMNDSEQETFFVKRAPTNSKMFESEEFANSLQDFNKHCDETPIEIRLSDHPNNADGLLHSCELMANKQYYKLKISRISEHFKCVMHSSKLYAGAVAIMCGMDTCESTAGIQFYLGEEPNEQSVIGKALLTPMTLC